MWPINRRQVYIIGDHEIVKKKIDTSDYTAPRTQWKCIRCKKRRDEKEDFKGEDCHECDCRFCDV